MRARHVISALGLAVALAGAADARSTDPRKGQLVPTGEVRNCLPLTSIRDTKIWDDNTIDFRVGRDIWRNNLPHSCPSLGFERRYAFKTSINEICSVDFITVLTNAGPGLMQGASCGLGKFEKVVKGPVR